VAECGPAFLEFDGVGSNVNCGSAATLDDLPDNAVAGKGILVVDGWYYAVEPAPATVDKYNFSRKVDVPGEGGSGWLFKRWAAGVGAVNEWEGEIVCAGARADMQFTTTETLDAWHHALFVYDETGGITPAARKIYAAIDGVWVAAYSTQTASAGNYNSDAIEDLEIGSGTLGVPPFFEVWLGFLGWHRIRNALPSGVTVGVNFTTPARCTIPARDVNTMLLVIYEGWGVVAHDLSGNANHGTITLATWSCDCVANTPAVVPSCEE